MADDDDDDCLLAKDAFEMSGGLGAFICVEDGQKLMDYLLRSDPLPALILLDLNMPRKDGREVLKEIKAIPAFQRIAIVILTTSSEEDDVVFSRKYAILCPVDSFNQASNAASSDASNPRSSRASHCAA